LVAFVLVFLQLALDFLDEVPQHLVELGLAVGVAGTDLSQIGVHGICAIQQIALGLRKLLCAFGLALAEHLCDLLYVVLEGLPQGAALFFLFGRFLADGFMDER
jgi:hypothetical protein